MKPRIGKDLAKFIVGHELYVGSARGNLEDWADKRDSSQADPIGKCIDRICESKKEAIIFTILFIVMAICIFMQVFLCEN